MTKNIDPRNVYELIENDNGEIMVLLFADEKAPQNPSFTLQEKNKAIELYRNKASTVSIDGLKSETIKKIKNLNKLYICELKYHEDENEENEIVYAYAAEHKEKTSPVINEETLSEKAKKARETIFKNSTDK